MAKDLLRRSLKLLTRERLVGEILHDAARSAWAAVQDDTDGLRFHHFLSQHVAPDLNSRHCLNRGGKYSSPIDLLFAFLGGTAAPARLIKVNMAVAVGVFFQILLMVFLGGIKIFQRLVFDSQGLIVLLGQGR